MNICIKCGNTFEDGGSCPVCKPQAIRCPCISAYDEIEMEMWDIFFKIEKLEQKLPDSAEILKKSRRQLLSACESFAKFTKKINITSK